MVVLATAGAAVAFASGPAAALGTVNASGGDRERREPGDGAGEVIGHVGGVLSEKV